MSMKSCSGSFRPEKMASGERADAAMSDAPAATLATTHSGRTTILGFCALMIFWILLPIAV
jgi:hypothetical protein